MMRLEQMLGQGSYVNQVKPSVLHRDYWALRAVRDELSRFFRLRKQQLNGAVFLDYGTPRPVYQPLADFANVRLRAADISIRTGDIVRINDDGSIDAEAGSYDGIISTQVMEHVPDPQLYLREALRVMKPGGLFFCTTHGNWILHRIPTDFRRWTIDGIRYEFETAGFEVESAHTAVGPLAQTTHLRAVLLGGMLRRVPVLGSLRYALYGIANLKMAIEDRITPKSARDLAPSLVIVVARKPV
jgi:SAM-dependent methyltransferase